jgi:hypothetical protein
MTDLNSDGLPILLGIKKGDSIDFSGSLVDLDGVAIDATGWSIRAEMYDDTNSIKKGSSLVTGGAQSQAEWIDALQGVFQIHLDALETNVFAETANFEIEIETASGKRFTIYQAEIQFQEGRINWDDVS